MEQNFALRPGATPRNAGQEPPGNVDRIDPVGTMRGADGRWDVGAFEAR